jgi:hypothetical protein
MLGARARQLLAVGLGALAVLVLWGPIPAGGGGIFHGEGTSITRWGALGVATVTTHLTWYAAGDVPVGRDVQLSWSMLAATCVLSGGVAWLILRLWRPSRVPEVPGDTPGR